MTNENTVYLNPDTLHPFENNPFQSVDEKEYDELRDSIQEFGIITPLIVNKTNGSYEIISGRRRWQIARELKLDYKVIKADVLKTLSGTKKLLRTVFTPLQQKKDYRHLKRAVTKQSFLSQRKKLKSHLSRKKMLSLGSASFESSILKALQQENALSTYL